MAKTNQEKLDDIWWILCADDGRPTLVKLIADGVLDAPSPLAGGGTTTPRTKVTFQKQEFNNIQGLIVALTETVRQLSVAQGVTIDYAAIAKAVNDDAAKRLAN